MTTPSAARWLQVFEVVDRALTVSPEDRSACIHDSCGADLSLAAAAAALLAGSDRLAFLEADALAFAAPLFAGPPPVAETVPSGSQVGPYRILREIGQGGMGSVYLAERADQQYDKTVAIKLLRRWSAGNERLVRRFREERQILAALDHPDIARLYDGGVTADGEPWFAMEYVEGVTIDRYCDERGLPIEGRLELFCRVCAAVQHAHRNLVVHRDLKPGNIMVTAEGGVKLLDFGIAKLLGNDEADGSPPLTETGERLMTLLYASPEQVRGEPVSTASDVYSLGVLLYELLARRNPYGLTTREPHRVARAILEQEPERPSIAVLHHRDGEDSGDSGFERVLPPAKLARRLRGDLDTIVGMAMQKEASRRYGSAERLEADVRRHLAGLPVVARADTGLYRTRKFVRRHRVGVTIAAGMALLVIAFAVVTGVQSLRIRAQAGRIALERDRAEQVSRFLAGLFQTSDPYAGAGGDLTARDILDSGAARVERELAGQPEARALMLLEMGRAYFGLGVRARARRFAETSLAIRRRMSSDGQLEIARTLDFLGTVLLDEGELNGAEDAHREALSLRRSMLGERHREVARTLNALAGVLRASGRFRDADSVSREAVTIDEAQSGSSRLDLAESLKGLAHAVAARGGHAEAVGLFRHALALERLERPAEHPASVATLLDLASALGEAGEMEAADSLFRQGLALERRALGDEHPEVAGNEARFAVLLQRRGDGEGAEALYRRSLATARRRLPAVHLLTATTLLGLGELLRARGAADRAEPLVREGLAMRRSVLPPGHPGIAEAEQAVGAVAMARGHYVEAETRFLLPSRQVLRAVYGDSDRRTRAATARLVELHEASGQRARASSYRAELASGSSPRPTGDLETVTRVLDRAPTLDATAVAVLPFDIDDERPSLADLRDVMHDLLAARFTGEGSPRALDPIAVTRALREGGDSHPGDLRLDESLRVARQLGAARLLRGDLAGTTHRLTVNAMLLDVSDGATLARARVEGAADSLPYLANLLIARLLAVAAARDAGELAGLNGTSLPALRAYLAGLHAHHRGRAGSPSEAMELFERALFLDSTFALAGLRLAEIATVWGMAEPEEQRWKLDAAWNLRGRLGPADRALLDAYLGPRYPRARTLAELIAAAEQATAAAPKRAEAWYGAGLSLFRFGSMIDYPEWEARAGAALRRGFALDSTDALTLEQLLQLAAQAGDRVSVRRYAGLYLAHNVSGYNSEAVRGLAAAVLGDSGELATVRSRLGRIDRESLRALVDWSSRWGVGLDLGDRAARLYEDDAPMSVGVNRSVTVAIVPYMLNRGRPDAARRLLATADRGFGLRSDVGVLEFRIFAALYWDGDTSEATAAARTLEAHLDGARVSPGQSRGPESAACALAQWRLETGDIGGAEAALGRMRRLRAPDGEYAIGSTSVCAAALEAQLAVVRHPSASVAALDRLDTLLRAGSDVRHLVPTVANLIAARLFEARGDLHKALSVARRRGGWTNQLLSTQLREEGRLAVLVGDTTGAMRAFRHYLALRTEPDSRLRPEVERVRTELLRVELSGRSPNAPPP